MEEKATKEERLKFCMSCKNRAFSRDVGVICGLTNKIGRFSGECIDYIEDKKVIQLRNLRENENIQNAQKKIKNVRIGIFIISAFTIIGGIYEAFIMDGAELWFGIIDWFIASLFIGFAIWSYRKPLPAFIVAFSFYLFIIILLAIVDPSTLFNGLIFKAVIVYTFVVGIKQAIIENKNKKKIEDDLLLDGDMLDVE